MKKQVTSQPVSVIIPNYNGQKLLEKNLPAVLKMLRKGDELIIIDDASSDDSWSWLTKQFGKMNSVQLLRNETNLRFGGTCNRAVQHAKHNLVFLINNDVSPHKDVLDFLAPHFSDPTVFAVACLEKEKHSDQLVLGGKKKLWFAKGMFMHSRASEFESGDTDWLSGGSSLFDKQKWLALGGFDADYAPAYWEDVDLSYRAKKRGWKVLFEKSAVVDHNHESTNTEVFGQEKIASMSWKNSLVFLEKNATFWQKIQHFLWLPYWLWQLKRERPSFETTSNEKKLFFIWGILAITIIATFLRFYKLGEVPHGMTWDEAAIGYNGFAIFTTRRDEWLQKLPVSFRSFGDYKAPLAIYLNGFFTFLFGLNLWAVRLPFAITGVFGVIGFMLLTEQLLRPSFSQTKRYCLALFAGSLITLSPWHQHFSRIAFESGLSLSFLIWGLYCATKFKDQQKSVAKNSIIWGASAAFFLAASLYAYHSAKVVVPLLLVALAGIFWKQLWPKWKWVFGFGALTIVLLLPVIKDMLFANGSERYDQISIFTLHLPLQKELILFLQNFVSHFTLNYLIWGKVTTLRHGDGHWGVLLPTTFLLVLCALILFFYKKLRKAQIDRALSQRIAFYILWIVIGVLPAAIGRSVPHGNRALLSLPAYLLLAVEGLPLLIEYLKHTKLNEQVSGSKGEKNLLVKSVIGMIFLLYGLAAIRYMNDYYTTYARNSAPAFQDGYIEALEYLQTHQRGVDKILITNTYQQPYIFVLFVNKMNPIVYQGGGLANYEFKDNINVGDLSRKNTLIVATPKEIDPKLGQKLIWGSNGKIRFVIVRTTD